MPTALEQAIAALHKVAAAHEDFYRAQLRIRAECDSMDQSNRVDCHIVTRRTRKLIEDIASECNNTCDRLARAACLAWIMATDPPDSIKGTLGSATVDVKEGAKLPRPGSDEYVRLMRWVGLTDEQIQQDLVRPHFTSWSTLATQCAKAGRPVPDGLLGTFPLYVMVSRPKRGAVLPGRDEVEE